MTWQLSIDYLWRENCDVIGIYKTWFDLLVAMITNADKLQDGSCFIITTDKDLSRTDEP